VQGGRENDCSNGEKPGAGQVRVHDASERFFRGEGERVKIENISWKDTSRETFKKSELSC